MGGPARTRRLLVLLTHKGDKVVERLLRESLVGNMWQVCDKDEKVTNMTRWQGSSTSKSRVGSMWGWFVLKLLIMICRYDLYHSVIAISSWKYPPRDWGMNYDRAEDGFATISNSCLARWGRRHWTFGIALCSQAFDDVWWIMIIMIILMMITMILL